MTQEEKQQLLKDICARLPYGVKVHITNEWFYDKIEPYDRRLDCDVIKSIRENRYTVKPYLRPLSSMTKEEKEYLSEELGFDENLENEELNDFGSYIYNRVNVLLLFDWLNKKMLDYNGLIPMGLALEAPKDMYK